VFVQSVFDWLYLRFNSKCWEYHGERIQEDEKAKVPPAVRPATFERQNNNHRKNTAIVVWDWMVSFVSLGRFMCYIVLCFCGEQHG